MAAFSLSILIFLSSFTLGYAIFPKRELINDPHIKLLLSPVVGLSMVVIFVNFASRLGLPVRMLGLPVFGSVVISAVLALRKLLVERKFVRTIAFIFSLPIMVTIGAWPMLKYGYKWLSYVNDDMTNYVLGAMRFFRYGFYVKPDVGLMSGTNYSQFYYYFEPKLGIRPGSELFLALVSSYHGGNSLQVFMPVIVALQMILIASAVALVRISIGVKRWQTITALLLLVCLPLMNLGYLYQLIGQVGGLAFAVAIIAVVSILFQNERVSRQVHPYLLLVLLLCGQLVWYPEIFPFVGSSIIISFIVMKKFKDKFLWLGGAATVLVALVILNKYFFQALKLSATQFASSRNVGSLVKLQVFPYFLKPQGIPAVFGFAPFNKPHLLLWENISILIGLIIFLVLALAPFVRPRQFNPGNIAILIMFVGFVFLVASRNAFGSYKLALYMQPFLVCSIVAAMEKISLILNFKSKNQTKLMTTSVLAILIIPILFETTQFYVSASTGTAFKGFSEIPEVSSSNLVGQIIGAESPYTSSMGPILSTTATLSQTKLEAIATQGKPILFLSRDPFKNISSTSGEGNSITSRRQVKFPDGSTGNYFQQLKYLSGNRPKNDWFLMSNDVYSSINKTTYATKKKFWDYKLIKNPVDYLVFINSNKAPIFDSRDKNLPALFPAEQNPMVHGAYIQSVGSTLLLQVENFRPHSNLIVNMSSTILSQYSRRIPNITIVGLNTIVGHSEGIGSSRLLIPGVVPITINNQQYIEIKFDQKLKPFPSSNLGFSKIYGSKIVYDSRLVSTFLSDLSFVSPSSAKLMNSPSRVNSFPRDLQNSELNYSGAYEDGWMSPSFYFDLKSTGSSLINISGFVPLVGKNKSFSTMVTPIIDGIVAKNFTLRIGNFNQDIQSNVKLVPGAVHKVEFRFKDSQILPEPDGRPASIFLTNLGFK